MSPLRLLIIDPHHHFRSSARNYLLRCPEFGSVETAASYDEGLLLNAQYLPDLVLVDREIFFANPGTIETFAKLKLSNPHLDVLVLFLFKGDCPNLNHPLSSLLSGVIYKENFAEGLLEYLASRKEQLTGGQAGSLKGVD